MADALLNSGTSAGEAQALRSNKPTANGRPAEDPPYKNGKHFLNPDEAAQVLRMDSRTLVRWARLGQVPAHPLGEGKRRLWRFIETELICWLEERGTPLKKPVANTMETAIGAHARRIA
jgi:hypothetical protein